MESALNYVNQQKIKVNEEDVARLSPLKYKHINVLGNYSFNLDDPIAQGNLRPLNIMEETC